MDVDIEDLQVQRDGRLVLDIPSLRLRGDRRTAIVGPNGAGKTTLLRVIAALERPRRGRILVGGVHAGSSSRTPSNVAFVFQDDVFLRQSVRANLELGLRLRGVQRSDRMTRIDEAAHLVGITHLLERRADSLSGGEGRRVSLARALCLRAALVLLDEPLAGLDPPTYSRLLGELPRLLQVFGSTAVIVTHDPAEALRLADDLVVLIDGRVHAAGDKRDVASNPAGAAVAEVLGYLLLSTDGRRLAVRPESLRVGPGPVEFWMMIDEVVDLVGRQEIVGHIGGTRVQVPISPADAIPRNGDRLQVHADRACDVT